MILYSNILERMRFVTQNISNTAYNIILKTQFSRIDHYLFVIELIQLKVSIYQ